MTYGDKCMFKFLCTVMFSFPSFKKCNVFIIAHFGSPNLSLPFLTIPQKSFTVLHNLPIDLRFYYLFSSIIFKNLNKRGPVMFRSTSCNNFKVWISSIYPCLNCTSAVKSTKLGVGLTVKARIMLWLGLD